MNNGDNTSGGGGTGAVGRDTGGGGQARASRDRRNVESGLDDLLGNVLSSDRARGGRRDPRHIPSGADSGNDATATMTAATTDAAAADDVDNGGEAAAMAADEVENGHDMVGEAAAAAAADVSDNDSQDARQTDAAETVVRRTRRSSAPPPISAVGEPSPHSERRAGLLATRTAEAQDRASSLTATVTLRIPHQLNDYLDEYVHGAWSRENRLRKQQLVIEALQMLYARRGRPGEEILPTDLLSPVE